MVPKIKETAGLVQEIAFASKQQSDGVSQISVDMGQLNEVAQQNAVVSKSLTEMSVILKEYAVILQEKIGLYKVE